MKILNIHFKNINSLEGENRIDFEKSPFSDTGVFAITGANGSGKSSILDAITLGLYGETFRFPLPDDYVMTKNTAESFSTIEFALNGERYQSSWSVHREGHKPQGEVQPSTMRLIRLNDGEVLASTPQQVCARMTEITGMNFRNFTRSVLLAQGDFAAFLNALDNERMDILEKIIGTDIYADYRNEVNDKAAAAEQQLNELKKELASITLLDPLKVEASEHDLIDFKDQYTELQSDQKTLKQQQTAVKNVAFLQRQIAAQEKSLHEAHAKIALTQEQLNKVAANESALPFEESLKTLDQQTQSLSVSKTQLAAFMDEMQQIKNRLGSDNTPPENYANKTLGEQREIISAAQTQYNFHHNNKLSESDLAHSLWMQIEDKKSQLSAAQAWLKEHAADESLLSNFPEADKLKALRGQMIELSAKQQTFSKHAQKTLALLKKNRSAFEKENQSLNDAKQELQSLEQEFNDLLHGKTITDVEELKVHQQERVNDFVELLNLAKAHQKLAGGGFRLLGIFGSPKPVTPISAADLRLKLEALKKSIKREENIRLVLEQAVVQENLLKKLLPDRQHLVNGKPCPLCGALQHPYIKYPPGIGNSQNALLDQKTKLKTLVNEADVLGQKINAAQKEEDKNQAAIIKLQQIKSQWSTLCHRLNVSLTVIEIGNIPAMQELLTHENQALKNITNLITQHRRKQLAITKLNETITIATATLQEIGQSIQRLETDKDGRTQEQLEIETTLAACIEEESQLAGKVIGQLDMLGEKMPEKVIEEDAFIARLKARQQAYGNTSAKLKTLAEDLKILESKLAASEAEIKKYDAQLDSYGAKLKTQEAIGLHLALIEKQQLIADKENQITRQQLELEAFQQDLQARLKQSQYATVQELKAALALVSRKADYEQQLTRQTNDIQNKTLELQKNTTQLETDQTNFGTLPGNEAIELLLKQTAEKMDMAQLDIQRLDKLLQEQKTLQQRYDQAVAALQQQEIIAKPYLEHAAQLAEESGMDFRRRVQAQLADKLLSQTNAVLEKISGRYYLRQSDSIDGLALEIEDTLQANARRQPRTLSGGESFVVSLALALGLSELANNGKAVDSLFLDEGFGNLDAETLGKVINTLDGLRNHGKTIGVISHVESVQKRFKAQLRLVKKPNGMGMLKKVS